MSEAIYDDTNLRRLFAEMDVKVRLKALKSAFRREANQVKKTAIGNLRNSIRCDRDMESGVRSVVYKKTAGFRVTVGTKRSGKTGKEYGFHKNRQGLKKPILIWAESGTEQRHTKTSTKIYKRARSGHNTGRMKRYGFMSKTLSDVKNEVTNDIHNQLIDSVTRTAKKYGCK